MKRKYNCGEMLLMLREEYKECEKLLEELKKYVSVPSDSINYNFYGVLADKDRLIEKNLIRLNVIKRYFYLLRKIGSAFCYHSHGATFNVDKNDEGLYDLNYYNSFYQKSMDMSEAGKSFYTPNVQITDPVKFSEIMDKVLSTELMKAPGGHFSNGKNTIDLYFDNAYISTDPRVSWVSPSYRTTVLDDSFISWFGRSDIIGVDADKLNSPYLINEMLSSEISSDMISPEWLSIFEKHEDELGQEVLFDIDRRATSKYNELQVANICKTNDGSVVKLVRKK